MKIKFLKNFKKYIYYKINYFSLKYGKEKRYHIKNNIETLNKLIEGYSISRYGDGELSLCYKKRKKGIIYQNFDVELSEKLRNILKSNLEKHLVAIPSSFTKIDNLRKEEAYAWSKYYIQRKKILSKILDKKKIYYDSMISRFYISYSNKHENNILLEKFYELFYNKNIIIIEGEKTRFGLGNSLLKNTKNISRILLPARDAYNKYNDVFNFVKNEIIDKENLLILIALGPTATVLAYDLCKLGFQAIDIGHLDIEYEWYLNNVTDKIDLENKIVSEVTGMSVNKEIKNSALSNLYEKQIIKKFL